MKTDQVEVAIMSACADMSSGIRGTAFGPNAVRNSWVTSVRREAMQVVLGY